MTYQILETTQFKKDCKLMRKRGKDLNELREVLELLQAGKPLPEKNRDHALIGDRAGFRECHIRPDWLLVYVVLNDRLVLTLMRTGTHSDLF
jgi:mRNA interferase YafQ